MDKSVKKSNSFYKYWGKAKKLEDESYDYHLLVYHCLDVAAVGKVWLEENKAFLRKATATTGLSERAFADWFLFFLSIHDLGKFKLSFQNLCPELLAKLQDRHNVDITYSTRHDQLGYNLYDEYVFKDLYNKFFNKTDFYFLKEYLNHFASPSFGHHGIPSGHSKFTKKPKVLLSYMETVAELFITESSIKEIETLLSLEKAERNKKRAEFKQFSWQLAGLITLCDWIASGDKNFNFCKEQVNLKVYFDESCIKAKAAVVRAEVLPSKLSSIQGMHRLFPEFADNPTPLQKYCNEVMLSNTPGLWILEDVAGAGKTEAALTLVSRILDAAGGTGCFVALPTMATSNAMYERMANIYTKLYEKESKPSLTLSHGARYLSKSFRDSYCESFTSLPHKEEIFNSDTEEGKAHCSQWLADSSKKALLSEVGVGTVDQLLLAGLPVRYQSLRAFGMSQKVLIIDEVHAFDSYMLTLLQNIISAQAAFGQSVVLLSATLPFSVREKFCKAYSDGLKIEYSPLIKKDVFPLITSVTAEQIREDGVKTKAFVERSVAVELCEDIENVFQLIEKSIEAGRCVCWIRNTISDVLDSYEELHRRGIENLDIFHSRFTLKDRLDIEGRVLKRFGKESKKNERTKQVLIASQVVEQSLDLDFDVLISDLAPIDLLIQRAGRLHRHNRTGRGEPVFYVHIPKDIDAPGPGWYSDAFPKGQYVYQNTALLWRTKEVLKKQKKLKMPDEARLLIESVYGDEEAFDVPDVFEKAEDQVWAKSMGDKSLANFNRLRFEQGYSRMASEKWDVEERVPTRLSDPVNALYLCKWDGNKITPLYEDSEFPWDVSSLSINKRNLNSIDYDDEILDAINNLKKKSRFKYDTLFIVLPESNFLNGTDENGNSVIVSYDENTGLQITREDK